MDDLISRQAAIDALKDMYYAAEKWGKKASDDVIKARAESCMASLIEMKLRIEKMPSAQPNLQPTCNQLATDTISRQAAIDAVNHICPVDTEYDCTLLDRVEVRCVLLDLPSAERKKGRWIHERLASTTGGSYPVVRCSICSGTIPFDWETKFCPHCGNRMRRGEEG